MKIAIIAANGRLGKDLVEESLKAGHIVRAGVRTHSNFEPHLNLEVVHCDATKLADIRNLIKGQEVVMSALGHVKGSPADVQTVATRLTIDAMKDEKILRFVDVTGSGIRLQGDKIGIVDRFLNFAVATVDPSRVKDGVDHMKLLRESNLEWTSVRVLKLQNTPAAPFTLTLHGPAKIFVSRYSGAKAMLQVAEEHSFIKESPILT